MPTGYTYKVREGEIIEFKDFAMHCARAFGACVEMRDDPMDAPIPEEFKPSSYHSEQLIEAKTALARLKMMSTDEKEVAARTSNQEELSRWEEWECEKAKVRQRYQTLLEKACAWTPPTPDHQGLKDFMIQQLTESMKWDCDPSPRPSPLKRDEWYEKALEQAEWRVNYHEKGHREEIERAKGRTEWIRALRRSLNA